MTNHHSDDIVTKRHLIEEMYQAGKTHEQVEAHISKIHPDNPLRPYFTKKYLEHLPEDQRDAARRRLNNIAQIRVMTAVGVPLMTVSADLVGEQIDKLIKEAYGTQPDNSPHFWMSDSLW